MKIDVKHEAAEKFAGSVLRDDGLAAQLYRAVCPCGWRSEKVSTMGEARQLAFDHNRWSKS